MKKSFVLGLVLSLSSLCFAGQKAVTVMFDKPTMVGSLKLVGEGKWSADDLAAALAAADRSRCGPVAPAQGLYLVNVDY